MGYLDLMLQPSIGGELSEEQGFFLRTIKQHVDTISGLLNNVLVLASIEAGTLRTDPQSLPLPRLVDEVLTPLRRGIEEKGLAVVVDLPEALPPVFADQEQMRIALAKLLDNALRYTEAGSITVLAHATDHHVQLDVSDTGPGIPPEDQQRLFTRFNRGGEQRGLAVRERGAGLGLAIARQLIERQGGTIWVQSNVGQGSTFSFTLPRTSEEQDHVTAEPQELDTITRP
jgi:signal transduction histidine kinase